MHCSRVAAWVSLSSCLTVGCGWATGSEKVLLDMGTPVGQSDSHSVPTPSSHLPTMTPRPPRAQDGRALWPTRRFLDCTIP